MFPMESSFSAYIELIRFLTLLFQYRADKMAHLTVGLLLWLIAAIVLRRPLGSWQPVLLVLLIELANETIEALYMPGWSMPDTLGDIASTLFFPVAIVTLVRLNLIQGQK